MRVFLLLTSYFSLPSPLHFLPSTLSRSVAEAPGCDSGTLVPTPARGVSVASQQGRTENPGERVGEVREVRSEKSEVRSFIAVFGRGSCD